MKSTAKKVGEFFCKLFKAFFALQNTAAATAMMAIGFIATIILAQQYTPSWAIIVCVILGTLGAIIMGCQWYYAFLRITEQENTFAFFEPIFGRYSDDWKRALKRLLNEGSINQQDVVSGKDDFRHCPFVLWDGGPGRFHLLPDKKALLAKLMKKWESSHKIN